MAVKLAFIGRVPGARPEEHRCTIKTPKYHLLVVMVEDQKQAIESCKKLADYEDIDQITLCPGFTDTDVGEITGALGNAVAVAVARRDSIGEAIMTEAKKREGLI